MEDLIIVSKWNNQNFTLCCSSDVEKGIQEAEKYYKESLDLVTSHRDNYPKDAEYWQKRIDEYTNILAGGFEAITLDEYRKREKAKWVTGELSEITKERYYDALNCLAPLNYSGGDDVSWFFIREMLTLSFTNQYYHDKINDKYYTAVVDLYDRGTWIDKLLTK